MPASDCPGLTALPLTETTPVQDKLAQAFSLARYASRR